MGGLVGHISTEQGMATPVLLTCRYPDGSHSAPGFIKAENGPRALKSYRSLDLQEQNILV